jgi:hypothetical protein
VQPSVFSLLTRIAGTPEPRGCFLDVQEGTKKSRRIPTCVA